MIPRPRPERFRLRRTMMFMNAQKPGLIKDAYIYGCDSIMLDLEDAVAENQKDAARFSLYHALKTIDYGDTEVIVRINGLDTPHWQEDIRVCVAGGADGIRIAKCESAQDVKTVEAAVEAAAEGFTDKMVAFQCTRDGSYACKTVLEPLNIVANFEKKVPRAWINEAGNGVTQEFIDYVLPLIQGETDAPKENALPRFARLKKVLTTSL